jgi:hypothetical protein
MLMKGCNKVEKYTLAYSDNCYLKAKVEATNRCSVPQTVGSVQYWNALWERYGRSML